LGRNLIFAFRAAALRLEEQLIHSAFSGDPVKMAEFQKQLDAGPVVIDGESTAVGNAIACATLAKHHDLRFCRWPLICCHFLQKAGNSFGHRGERRASESGSQSYFRRFAIDSTCIRT
jgi:hypothetical protein